MKKFLVAFEILLLRHVVEYAFNIYKFVHAIRLLFTPNGYIETLKKKISIPEFIDILVLRNYAFRSRFIINQSSLRCHPCQKY
jgi:hypothetical protein